MWSRGIRLLVVVAFLTAGAVVLQGICKDVDVLVYETPVFKGWCEGASEPGFKEEVAGFYNKTIVGLAGEYGYDFQSAGDFFNMVQVIQEVYGNIEAWPETFTAFVDAIMQAVKEVYGSCMPPDPGGGPWTQMTQTNTASTYYEALTSCGYDPQKKLFTAVIEIRQPFGFGGTIPGPGSWEHVQFCVDWNEDGVFQPWESEGIGRVHLHNDSRQGEPNWYFAVIHRPTAGLKTAPLNGRTLQARAVLSWMMVPTKCSLAASGIIWGNELSFQIRLDP